MNGPTNRELDVLALVARGLPNAEITAGLGFSPATVKSCVESNLAKLRLREPGSGLVVAYETGLAFV
jgi:DNA-binding NarL/FixJ family response regulator